MISITQKIRNRVTRMTKRLTISKNYRVKSKTTGMEEFEIESHLIACKPTFSDKGTISVNELLSSGAWRSPDAISFHEFRSSVRKPIDFHWAICVFILFYRPKSRKLQSYYQIAHFVESKSCFFSIWLLNK